MQSIKELTEERKNCALKARAIYDRADAEGRQLNSEERAETDKLETEVDRLGDVIKEQNKRTKLAAVEADFSTPLPRQTEASRPGSVPPLRGEDGKLNREILSIDWGKHRLPAEPGSRLHQLAQPAYAKAISHYLLTGEKSEQLGFMVGDDSKGGYAVPTAMVSGIVKFLDDDVTMRRLGTVLPPITAKSAGVLSYDTDLADSDWTAEVPASDISEDSAARFGNREMTPHLLTKLVKVSKKFLRGATISPEAFIAQRLAYRFALTENKKFLSGTGSQQPLGAFVASTDGVTTARDTTCASATVFTADELMNLRYSLKAAYAMKSTWVFHRDFMLRARKLKDGNGQYLWAPGLGGQPDTLLDRPIALDENAPNTFTTGLYIAMLADWSFYYIQDGVGMSIQSLFELFSLKNQVGYIGSKETDGMPVLAEAFARLKLA